MSRTVNVEGDEEVEAVEITVRLGARALALLRSRWVACTKVWLTEQPDGTFALGVVTAVPPDKAGLEPRAVEADDRERRFPDWDGGFDAP